MPSKSTDHIEMVSNDRLNKRASTRRNRSPSMAYSHPRCMAVVPFDLKEILASIESNALCSQSQVEQGNSKTREDNSQHK